MARAMLALSLALSSLAAGEPVGTWQTVMDLPPGAQLTIERSEGKKLKGRLIRASQESLAVSQGASSADIDKAAVRRIYSRRRGSVLGPVLGGAALGAIPGLIFGRVAASVTSSNTSGAAVGAFCVGAGAGIGLLAWAIYRPTKVIYDSGSPPQSPPGAAE